MPAAWRPIVDHDLPLLYATPGVDVNALMDPMRIIIDERWWEGGSGFEVNDRVRVVVAGQLAFQFRGLGVDALSHARTIIMYERAYRPAGGHEGEDGVIHEGGANLGEAWFNGPVVLSWGDALHEARRSGTGENVVFHEFAHVLDAVDGTLDGTPPLPDAATRRRWHEVMSRAFDDLAETWDSGGHDVLRPYALTNPAEFFAVTTELFFDAPVKLAAQHPAVYDLFTVAWNVNPVPPAAR